MPDIFRIHFVVFVVWADEQYDGGEGDDAAGEGDEEEDLELICCKIIANFTVILNL